MAFSHNLLTLWTIRNLEMLAIFTSNQGRHEFGENYERAVVKKTERHSALFMLRSGENMALCVAGHQLASCRSVPFNWA